jgi:hypothetical protein
VRLEILAEVYAVAARDLRDLRLEADGQQVPFLLLSPPDPALAFEVRSAEPTASSVRGVSRVEQSLAASNLPLTVVHVTASPGVFRRRLRVGIRRPQRPGTEPGELWSAPWSSWVCRDPAPIPCRQVAQLPATDRGTFLLELDDGDNPPFPSLDLEAWRRRHELLFVWPGGDPVHLWAGCPELASPRFDLAALGPQLRGLPWVPAELGALVERRGRGEWRRWALIGSLVLAAVVLLWILARALRMGEVAGS